MSLEAEKLELIEKLLNTEQESILAEVRAILEEGESHGSLMTEEQFKIVEEERRKHLAGEGKSYTLEEVMESAKKTIQDVRADYKRKSSK